MSVDARQPSTQQIVAYSAPLIGSGFFYNPMWGILPGIYVKYFGLDLTVVAAVALIIRLFDGVTDPAIGYLSDRHRSLGGARKYWVLAGGMLIAIICYFLFYPPSMVTAEYFLFWSLMYFLALTLMDIPHYAWGAELTRNYNIRAKVYSVRNMASMTGFLLFSALPLLPLYETSEYTPQLLCDAWVLGSVLMLSGLLYMAVCAPKAKGRSLSTEDQQDSVALYLRSLINNKPLLIYFAGYLAFGLSLGMWIGLQFIYVDAYLGMGKKLAIIYTVATVAGVLSTPLWLKLIKCTSKHSVWALSAMLFAGQMLCVSWLDKGFSWYWLLICQSMAYIGFSGHNVASISTLGDIIDYGQLVFKKNRSATYIAFNNLLYKWGIGIGTALGFAIAGFYGFDPTQSNNSLEAIHGLKIAYLYLPMLLSVVAVIFILVTPITRDRHRIIEQRLARRAVSQTGNAVQAGEQALAKCSSSY